MQLPEERRRLILDAVEREGKVLAAELATRLGASEDTVRRDLRDLDNAGLLRRVHGGALRRSAGEAPLQQRAERDGPRKAALGQALRSLVQPTDTVLIDAGSTNLALANQLDDGCAAAIVTNSPQVALALRGFQRTRIVLIGGVYSPACGAALGAQAVAEVGRIHADLCIVGVCAVHAQKGLYAADPEEAMFKRAMLAASGRRAAAVLNERLLDTAPFAVAALAELGHLVLEADAPPEVLARLREAADGPDILLANKVA